MVFKPVDQTNELFCFYAKCNRLTKIYVKGVRLCGETYLVAVAMFII